MQCSAAGALSQIEAEEPAVDEDTAEESRVQSGVQHLKRREEGRDKQITVPVELRHVAGAEHGGGGGGDSGGD